MTEQQFETHIIFSILAIATPVIAFIIGLIFKFRSIRNKANILKEIYNQKRPNGKAKKM